MTSARKPLIVTLSIVLVIIALAIGGVYIARSIAVGNIEKVLDKWVQFAAGERPDSQLRDVLCDPDSRLGRPAASGSLAEKFEGPIGGFDISVKYNFTAAYAEVPTYSDEESEVRLQFVLRKVDGKWKICDTDTLFLPDGPGRSPSTFLGWMFDSPSI